MDIERELEALRDNLLAETEIRYVSLAQIGGINGLIRKGVENKGRQMRMAILRMWAGDAIHAITREKLDTSKKLTSPVASFLINLLLEPETEPWELSDYGKELLKETERLVNKQWGIEQLEIPIKEK